MGKLLHVLRNAFRSPGFRLFGLPFARDYLRFAARCARAWGSTRPGSVDILGARIDYPNQTHALFLVHEVFVQGAYDFAAAAPAPRIIDCGANIGFSIFFFKARHPDCTITAFEPHPATFALLRSNLERSGIQGVEIRQLAVAEEEGSVALVCPEDDPGSLSASISAGWTDGRPIPVSAVRLSSVIDGPVDLLKLDVEGAEYGVVRDLVETGAIAHVREAIIEFHEAPDEPRGAAGLRQLLETAGMVVHVQHEPSSTNGLLRARREGPRPLRMQEPEGGLAIETPDAIDRGTPDLEPALAVLRSAYERRTRAGIHELAKAHDLPVPELYNALSLTIARRFLDGAITFDDADGIANNLYAMMVEDAVEHGGDGSYPEPAFAIYDAFDAGEWDRGDGSDPVERYTKPALREILRRPPGTS